MITKETFYTVLTVELACSVSFAWSDVSYPTASSTETQQVANFGLRKPDLPSSQSINFQTVQSNKYSVLSTPSDSGIYQQYLIGSIDIHLINVDFPMISGESHLYTI